MGNNRMVKSKKVTYIVYPANYKPGKDNYYEYKTKLKAAGKAVSLGRGAEVHKHIDKRYQWEGKFCRHIYTENVWEIK